MRRYILTSVKSVRCLALRVVFDDGLVGELDLRQEIAAGAMFAPLANQDYFKQVAVAPGGHAFGWNLSEAGNEIDFCADAARIDIETRMVSEMADRRRSRRTRIE